MQLNPLVNQLARPTSNIRSIPSQRCQPVQVPWPNRVDGAAVALRGTSEPTALLDTHIQAFKLA